MTGYTNCHLQCEGMWIKGCGVVSCCVTIACSLRQNTASASALLLLSSEGGVLGVGSMWRYTWLSCAAPAT